MKQDRINVLYIDTLIFRCSYNTIFKIYEKNFATLHPSKFLIEGTGVKIIQSPIFEKMKKRVYRMWAESNYIIVEVY